MTDLKRRNAFLKGLPTPPAGGRITRQSFTAEAYTNAYGDNAGKLEITAKAEYTVKYYPEKGADALRLVKALRDAGFNVDGIRPYAVSPERGRAYGQPQGSQQPSRPADYAGEANSLRRFLSGLPDAKDGPGLTWKKETGWFTVQTKDGDFRYDRGSRGRPSKFASCSYKELAEKFFSALRRKGYEVPPAIEATMRRNGQSIGKG